MHLQTLCTYSGSEELTNFWKAWGKQRNVNPDQALFLWAQFLLLETTPRAVSFQGLVISSCYNTTEWVFQCHLGFLKPAPKLDSPSSAQSPSESNGHSQRCPAWCLLVMILFPFDVLCNHLFSCFAVLFSPLTLQSCAGVRWMPGLPG